MGRAFLLVAALAAVISTSASAKTPDPSRMVLTLGDLPTGFAKSATSPGYMSLAAAAKSSNVAAAVMRKRGYVAGFEADYSRSPSLADLANGAIEIDSTVSIYHARSGAISSLNFTKTACTTHGTKLSVGAVLGEASSLCRVSRKSGGMKFDVYVISWQYHNVRASVVLAGISGGVSPLQAVKLAQAQQRRIRPLV